MSYAIIGFGNIGQALARAFARKGIEVSVATKRNPEGIASAAAAIGPTVIPKTLVDAIKADVIFLAVRFESHPEVAKTLPAWQGKTIVDVTNAYGIGGTAFLQVHCAGIHRCKARQGLQPFDRRYPCPRPCPPWRQKGRFSSERR
jgi:predicted dinucleotide-binding enzyme